MNGIGIDAWMNVGMYGWMHEKNERIDRWANKWIDGCIGEGMGGLKD